MSCRIASRAKGVPWQRRARARVARDRHPDVQKVFADHGFPKEIAQKVVRAHIPMTRSTKVKAVVRNRRKARGKEKGIDQNPQRAKEKGNRLANCGPKERVLKATSASSNTTKRVGSGKRMELASLATNACSRIATWRLWPVTARKAHGDDRVAAAIVPRGTRPNRTGRPRSRAC